MRKVQEFSYPFPSGALLVMHSDGLASHSRLDRVCGLDRRHHRLIAGWFTAITSDRVMM